MSGGKKYGGMYKHENHNNVVAHSIITDTFTLRNAYNGTFDISGNLHVSNDAQFDSNVFSYNNYVYNNIVGSNNLYVLKDTEIYGNVEISGNTVITNGKLTLYKGLDISGDVLFPNKVYLREDDVYFVSSESRVIDACNTDFFNINSSKNENQIIMDSSDACIGIYDSIEDNRFLVGVENGRSYIYTDTNLTVSSGGKTGDLFGEKITIYGEESDISRCEVLTLVGHDNTTPANLNIVTPNKNGIYISGGKNSDASLSYGIIGLYGASQEYYPAISVYKTSSDLYHKSHIGFNRVTIDNSYSFHFNGTTKLTNQEISYISELNLIITKVAVNTSSPNIMVAFNHVSGTEEDSLLNYLYTDNGWKTWTQQNIPNSAAGSTQVILHSYIDNNRIYFATSDKIFYYIISIGGNTWQPTITFYTNIKGIYFNNSKLYVLNGNKIEREGGANHIIEDMVPSGIIGYNDTMYIYGENKVNTYITSSPDIDTPFIRHSNEYIVVTLKKYESTILSLAYNVNDRQHEIITKTGSVENTYTISSSQVPSPIINIEFISSDSLLAITSSNIYYSTGNFSSWRVLTDEDLNGGGTASLLTSEFHFIKHIVSSPSNIIFFKTPDPFSNPTDRKSKIYNAYLPILYNKSTILSVDGSVDILGNINVDGNLIMNGGGIITTSESFSLLELDVSNIYIGHQESTTYLNSDTTYLKNIRAPLIDVSNLNISQDLRVTQNAIINGNTTIEGTVIMDNFIVGNNSFIFGGLTVQGPFNSTSQNILTNSQINNDFKCINLYVNNIESEGNVNVTNDLNVYNKISAVDRIFIDTNITTSSNIDKTYYDESFNNLISLSVNDNSTIVGAINSRIYSLTVSGETQYILNRRDDNYYTKSTNEDYNNIIKLSFRSRKIVFIESSGNTKYLRCCNVGTRKEIQPIFEDPNLNDCKQDYFSNNMAACSLSKIYYFSYVPLYDNGEDIGNYHNYDMSFSTMNGVDCRCLCISNNGKKIFYTTYVGLIVNVYSVDANANIGQSGRYTFGTHKLIASINKPNIQTFGLEFNDIQDNVYLGICDSSYTFLYYIQYDKTSPSAIEIEIDNSNSISFIMSEICVSNKVIYLLGRGDDSNTIKEILYTFVTNYDYNKYSIMDSSWGVINSSSGDSHEDYKFYIFGKTGVDGSLNVSDSVYANNYVASGDYSGNNYNARGNINAGGDVSANSYNARGSVNVVGDVSANSYNARGSVTVVGDVSANNYSARGSVNVVGDVSANNYNARGRVNVVGDVSANNYNARGRVNVLGDVSANNYNARGSVTVVGDVSANTLNINTRSTLNNLLAMNGSIDLRGDLSLNSTSTIYLTKDGLHSLKYSNESITQGIDPSLNGVVLNGAFGGVLSASETSKQLWWDRKKGVTVYNKLNAAGGLNTYSGEEVFSINSLGTSYSIPNSINGLIFAGNSISYYGLNKISGVIGDSCQIQKAMIAGYYTFTYSHTGSGEFTNIITLRIHDTNNFTYKFSKFVYNELTKVSTSAFTTYLQATPSDTVLTFGYIETPLSSGNTTGITSQNFSCRYSPIRPDSIFTGITALYGETYIYNKFQVEGDVSFNSGLFVNKDASLNSTLSVTGDASFYNLVYVTGDVSFNRTLFVNKDVSFNQHLFVDGDTYLNSTFSVQEDASFNSRLYASGDVSFNNGLFVNKDVSFNSTLCVTGDASFYNRVYVTGDVSFNNGLFINKDASLNQRLFVAGDTSLNSTFKVQGDASFNNRFYASGDVSFNNGLFINKDASLNQRLFVAGDTSLNSTFKVQGDASFNNRLYASGDVSFNNGLFINKDASFNRRLFVAGDTSLNSTFKVQGDASFNNRLYASGDVSFNNGLFVNKDASFNRRLFVAGDTSLNSTFKVQGDASFNNRLYVSGDVSFNNGIFINRDASLNQRLFVAGDTSLNSTFKVQGDASFNNRLYVSGDVSFNNGIFVNRDASFNQRLFVVGDTSLNSTFKVQGDASFNNRLYASGDVSFNNGLFVNRDASFNQRLFVAGDTSFNSTFKVQGDASFNSRLYASGDVSFNNGLFVNKDASFNRRLFVAGDTSLNSTFRVQGDASFNNRLYASGDVSFNNGIFVNRDASFNRRLFVAGDTSLNSTFKVQGDASFNSRLYASGDVSFNNGIFVNKDASFNRRLFVAGDTSLNSTFKVQGDASFNSRLYASGDISCKYMGIGKTNNGTGGYALDVSGKIQATGYNATSDKRLKINIKEIEPQWDNIKLVVPSEYVWRGNNHIDYGFIAQELFEVYPNLRNEYFDKTKDPVDSEGNPLYYTIDYGKMTPYIWKGLKEVIQAVENHTNEIKELKNIIKVQQETINLLCSKM